MTDRFAPTEVTSGVPVAWVTQGSLIYVRGSLQPIWPQVLAAWDHITASSLLMASVRHYRLWSEMDWRSLDGSGRTELRAELERGPGQLAYWRVDAANRVTLPDVSLEIVDVPPTQGRERASYVRLRVPLATEPDALIGMTRALSDLLPFWAGTAGFFFNPVEAEWRPAFDQIWAWARRYWGVEVADTRGGTWDVRRGLLNVNWLTLLGSDFLATLREEDRPIALDSGLPASLRVQRTRFGAIVQAGASPVLGDLNAFEDLSAYADATRVLEPALVLEPTSFAGMFGDHSATLPWIRRFLRPEAWLDRDAI